MFNIYLYAGLDLRRHSMVKCQLPSEGRVPRANRRRLTHRTPTLSLGLAPPPPTGRPLCSAYAQNATVHDAAPGWNACARLRGCGMRYEVV